MFSGWEQISVPWVRQANIYHHSFSTVPWFRILFHVIKSHVILIGSYVRGYAEIMQRWTTMIKIKSVPTCTCSLLSCFEGSNYAIICSSKYFNIIIGWGTIFSSHEPRPVELFWSKSIPASFCPSAIFSYRINYKFILIFIRLSDCSTEQRKITLILLDLNLNKEYPTLHFETH